jgi:broad specificity phosphatase PhoE
MLSRRQICTLLAATLFCGCEDKGPIVVYVVRHAEKEESDDPAAGPGDPNLSADGKSRAAALLTELGQTKLTAVFSSQYKRTQQTVEPAAKAQNLEVQKLDAAKVRALVEKIRDLDAGSSALVAGHSNTVPAILQALGVKEQILLGEDAYGDLFVVTLSDKPKLERRRFGP